MKIEKVNEPYYKRIKKTDSTLCCAIKPEIQCKSCKVMLCKDCGRAWSGRRHFILDMCRNRFTPEQITESNTCFKKRMVKGEVVKGLGDCFVCSAKRNSMDSDRLLINQPRHRR